MGIQAHFYHHGKEGLTMSDAISSIPIIGPMIGGVMDVFGAGPQSQAMKRQEDMADYMYEKNADLQNQQTQLWKENAFPTQAEINTQRASGIAGLGTERSKRYEQLARSLSTRGIGPGSAYASRPASAIEGSYLTGLSNLENTLINAQNKPRFNMPFIGAPSVPTASTGGSSNPLGMALGMVAGGKALDKYFGAGADTTYPNMMAGASGESAMDPFMSLMFG
jgi:hypothetical protein